MYTLFYIGDIDKKKAKKFVAELGDERFSAIKVNAHYEKELVNTLKKFNTVTSTLLSISFQLF